MNVKKPIVWLFVRSISSILQIKYPQILQKYFLDWSVDISQSLIDYIKFSKETQWRLVTAACKICSKYTKDIILRLHPYRVTNWHYVAVKKKTVVSLHQSHKKCTLGWHKENGSNSIITIKSHSITNNIQMRRHLQVMCGIW